MGTGAADEVGSGLRDNKAPSERPEVEGRHPCVVDVPVVEEDPETSYLVEREIHCFRSG